MPSTGTRCTDRSENVARRSIAAGNEQQIDARVAQGERCGPGVGALVPSPGGVCTMRGSWPARSAASAPISPAHVSSSASTEPAGRSARGSRAHGLRPGRSSRARAASSPSVPFEPTAPPMPAIGLTMRPMRRDGMVAKDVSNRRTVVRNFDLLCDYNIRGRLRRLPPRAVLTSAKLRSRSNGATGPCASVHAQLGARDQAGAAGRAGRRIRRASCSRRSRPITGCCRPLNAAAGTERGVGAQPPHARARSTRTSRARARSAFSAADAGSITCPRSATRSSGAREFLTPVWGTASSDLGRNQAWFEFTSQLGELLELDLVGSARLQLGMRGGSCTAHGRAPHRAAARSSCPGYLDPERRAVIANYCEPPQMPSHIAMIDVDYRSGRPACSTLPTCAQS